MDRKRQCAHLMIVLTAVSTLYLQTPKAAETMNRPPVTILDFNQPEARQEWRIVNDGVMGGVSQSEISFSGHGSGVFAGTLSLDNNGGFASVRRPAPDYDLGAYSGLTLKVIGDGRDYQLRLRTDARFDGISYRFRFATVPQGAVTVTAPFIDFEPVFRGRVVSGAPPLDPARIEQLGVLIADGKAGPFRLEILEVGAWQ